jgi:hypothetical protein
VDLKSIKLINYDPTKYRRNDELMTPDEVQKAEYDIVTLRNQMGFTDEEFLEEMVGGDAKTLFTDDMRKNADDLLKKYADEIKAINRYIEKNLGNLREEDDRKELLFKMLEHVRHVNEHIV